MLKALREKVEARQSAYFKLVDLQNEVADAEHAIKKQLIDMGATEALTIQWSRLRRMIKER